MSDFDFSTLNSADLEELVCDLLNAEERKNQSQICFKTFKDGKDKGIDLLYSTEDCEYEIVGQVKHYYRSGFSLMIKELVGKEKDKVLKLQPNKYIFATSVDLSVSNTEEIKNVFAPYIKSLNDIYGKKDLNRLIDSNKSVLDRHFKLWFSSAEILLKILKYNIEGRSNEFKETFLKKKFRLYVNTPILEDAKDKLERNNFVIITGEPGAGKTTTAELILYDYLKNDFMLSYIYDDIKEIESVLKEDETKQIFYYDDFLGHNAYEIIRAKSSETAFLRILQRINRSKNKKIIFTTRTFILNEAVSESEKLRRFNLKTRESILKLNAYSWDMKASILKNHINESEIDDILKFVISDKIVFNYIVSHNNFSPRSVEYITSSDNIKHFSAEAYRNFIIENFNNPDEIWRHAYEQQINDIDRFLLNTLVCFGDTADVSELEIAFNYRIDYEVRINNFIKPMNAFKTSYIKLEGGFIEQETRNLKIIKFINPSLIDFLVSYLRNDIEEVKRISESAYYLDQLTRRLFPPVKKSSIPVVSDRLESILLYNYDFFVGKGVIYLKDYEYNYDQYDTGCDFLEIAVLIYFYVKNDKVEETVINVLRRIDDWSFLYFYVYSRYIFNDFIANVESDLINEFLKDLIPNIVDLLISAERDYVEVLNVIELITEKFEIDFVYILNNNKKYNLEDHVKELLDEKIENDIEELLTISMAQDFVDHKERETKDLIQKFKEYGLDVKVNLAEYGKYNWWDIGFENYFEDQMRKDD
ncbi:ATP-binding protein [Rufibacter tibetensis]|uniref:Novel STAND NTPase 3 domain-containing protein n=1 Tax=Rufibacter tibetensis TaxID=512763 RepID=A0A0P0C3X5_9BACT|nr:ATP-binding protein [Rufibacter tibetensis]ALI97788.1 hypothetical protein DC20_00770 [Rufibacter tibetensis]